MACRFALASAMAAAIALMCPWPAVADDCPPLAGAPGFHAVQGAEHRAYDAIEFIVLRNSAPTTAVVAGAKCYQVYVAEDWADVTALHARYRKRLERLGAQIVFADRHRLHARLTETGRESWLRVRVENNEIDITVVRKQALTPSLTRPSGGDYRLIGHMPNYEAVASTKHADEVRRFTVPGRDDMRTVEVRGGVHEVTYRAKSRSRLSSDVEIQENYRAALRALGAEILVADWRTTVARHIDHGRMIWLRVTSQVSEIAVLAVENKLPSAQPRLNDRTLAAAFVRDGRVTIAAGLGVGDAPAHADRNIVGQVVRLLRRDRTLALMAIVHSDDLGDRGANFKRSQARAEAIAMAVLKQGIARDRVKGIGAGPDQPVADNATVEGRARNRRIELVRERIPPPPLPPARPDQ